MSRTLRVTPTALETLAEHWSRAIELDPATGRGYLNIADTTYWAQVVE